MQMHGIIKRKNTYQLRRRVPSRYASVEERPWVLKSLKTDSLEIAKTKAAAVWSELIEGWEARLAGDTDDAEMRFAAAKNLAETRGYRFMRADKVANLPLDELIGRIEDVRSTKKASQPDLAATDAILGSAEEPRLTASKALKRYWEIAKDKTAGMSQDQIRRWENPRKKAVANFVSVIGDHKDISRIMTSDLVKFREWWIERIEEKSLTPNSANKDFIHLTSILRDVAWAEDKPLIFDTSRLSIKEGRKRTRLPWSTEWIKSKLLEPGALKGLNTEARCILLGMINTGYRPSEAQNMTSSQIRLDCDIPHVSIEPVDRKLKNDHSQRIIPLTGVSLEAFKECPDGFPRYKDKPGLSGTINKFLREAALCETEEHTLYGLRHSFEDRMLAAGIDERVRRDLMGHSLQRERYGEGGSLKFRRVMLLKIAL